LDSKRLHEAAGKRYSCRSYQQEEPKELQRLHSFLMEGVTDYQPGIVRYDLIVGVDAVSPILKAPFGPVPALLVISADMNEPYAMESTGFGGQQAVLEAAALGLATCWVSGMFSRSRAEGALDALAPGWQAVAVVAVGRAAPAARTTIKQKLFKFLSAQRGRRRPVGELLHPVDFCSLPRAAVEALTAATRAPSALNRQPWAFALNGSRLAISSTRPKPHRSDATRLDCGIAMLEFQAAARAGSMAGSWHPEAADDNPIASFPLSYPSSGDDLDEA